MTDAELEGIQVKKIITNRHNFDFKYFFITT